MSKKLDINLGITIYKVNDLSVTVYEFKEDLTPRQA